MNAFGCSSTKRPTGSANANWVMVHAAAPRTCRVRLPRRAKRVYDIVAERELAADADEVEVVLGDIQTAVLLVDDRP